jgi:hypothetical protein
MQLVERFPAIPSLERVVVGSFGTPVRYVRPGGKCGGRRDLEAAEAKIAARRTLRPSSNERPSPRRHVAAVRRSSLLEDRHFPGRTMLHNQFEDDLIHLEQIVPLLASGSPLGLSYWRRRIASLSAHQDVLPKGKTRVIRLFRLSSKLE